MDLSIIIPIYNIEVYIKACLESVFLQPLYDFEVICVNDGSTDNSQSVIDQFAKIHPNLRCICQPNTGLSEARNTGLKNANGKYIFFLDGDDTLIDNHSLATALQTCFQNNLDLFIGNAVVDSHNDYLQNYPKNNGTISGLEMMCLFMNNNRTLIEPVWCYLYNKSFLDTHQLRFKKGIYHEDILFTPQALYHAERTICQNISFVNYQTHRAGAITTTISIKHLTDKRDTARELYCFYLTKSIKEPMIHRIIFDIYADVIKSAYANHISIKDIIMSEDRRIMSLCAITNHDRMTTHMLRISPTLSARYSSNTLHPILRKVINLLPL